MATGPSRRAPDRRIAAKLDQTGLIRMQRQCELLEPQTHRIQKATSVALVLEAGHLRVSHDDPDQGTACRPGQA